MGTSTQLIDQTISHYRVIEKLGGGGMVWSTRLKTRTSTASSPWWATAPDRPGLPRGHHFRGPQRYSLADAAAKTGLRLGYELLAAVARLAAGIWDLIHFVLLDWLARDGQIDWSRAMVDSCSVRAVFGPADWANPTDSAKHGSKPHLICDGHGIPLAIRLTGANCHDSTQALPLLDGVPSLQGRVVSRAVARTAC